MISAENLRQKKSTSSVSKSKKDVNKKEISEKQNSKKLAYIEKRRAEKSAFREVLQTKTGAERVSCLINDRKNVKASVKAFVWKFANSLAAGGYPTLDTVKTDNPPIYCPVMHTLIPVGEECYILSGFAGMRLSKEGFKAITEFVETEEFKTNPRAKQEIERLKFEGGNISLSKKTAKALEESGLLKADEPKVEDKAPEQEN